MHECHRKDYGCVENEHSHALLVYIGSKHFEASFCPLCGYQPERSKREDLTSVSPLPKELEKFLVEQWKREMLS